MKSIWERGLFASSALVGAFGLTAVAAPASAQTAATPAAKPAAAEAPADVSELVIVGSRIRRDNYTSPAPVQVITREESTLAGFASTTAQLQGTAVTGGSGQINNAFGGFVTDGGPGANTLGLRGLGATRTLILLNGRRLAPSGTRGAVGSADLNVLPSAIVDRIEILKDGASSIYGSDAVAGVVNIITKRGVDGWTLEGQANKTGRGGGDQYRASVVGGYTSDRFEFSGSVEYYNRGELTQEDRPWTRCATDYRFDPVTGATTDFIDPATGKPKCFGITSGTGSQGVTINTIGTASRPGVPAAATTGTRFTRWRPNAAVTTGLVGFEGVSVNSRTTFEPQRLKVSLISPSKSYTGYLQGSYDLRALGNAELYSELLYSRRESSQTGYRQLTLDYPIASPLLPAPLSGLTSQVAGATTGTAVRAFLGFGLDTGSQEANFYKLTGGMRGEFVIPKWRYDLTFTYSKADADYTFESFLTDRVNKSLSAVASGSGFACTSTITNPNDGCVAAPVLTPAVIGGQIPQAYRDYIFRPVTGNTQYSESVITATIDGPLFELPFGEVKGAFGLEYRKNEIDDQPPADSVNGNLFNLTSAAPTKGKDSVWEAYAEVEVPLLANVYAAKELTLNLSGRYTDYDSYGSDETYKVGLQYTPVSFLTLRGTYGTSFRAPALFEQFQGGTSGFLSSAIDPCNDYGQSNPNSTIYKNCNAELNNPAFQQLGGVAVITAGGAAQGLSAETSKNFTYGVIFQPKLPTLFGDVSLAVDYYNIEVKNEVDRVGASNLLDLCYNDPQFRAGGGYCRFIATRPSTGALTVYDSYTNIATQIVEGLDYTLRWVKDIGEGTLRVNALVTQYMSQANKLFSTDPLDELNGTINNPKYTATIDTTYTYKKWRVRYGLEWLAATDSNSRYGIDPTVDPYIFTTPDYFLHSLSVRYTKTGDWEATAGVRNLLDQEPPSISQGVYNRVGNAPLYSGYDYVGRTFFVNVSKTF